MLYSSTILPLSLWIGIFISIQWEMVFFFVVYFIPPDFILFEITSSGLHLKMHHFPALSPMPGGCCADLEHVLTPMPTFTFLYDSDACDCLLEMGCLTRDSPACRLCSNGCSSHVIECKDNKWNTVDWSCLYLCRCRHLLWQQLCAILVCVL